MNIEGGGGCWNIGLCRLQALAQRLSSLNSPGGHSTERVVVGYMYVHTQEHMHGFFLGFDRGWSKHWMPRMGGVSRVHNGPVSHGLMQYSGLLK